MAPTIQTRKRRGAPRQVVSGTGFYYPGEVARILGLGDIDYRQLRELRGLVSSSDERTPKRKWGRYSYRDLVLVRNAIHLAGGPEALKLGRRLRIRQLSRVVDVLKTQFGLTDPLTQIRLEVLGSSIVAHISGARLDPMRSQYVFAEILDGVKRYLKNPPDRGPTKKISDIRQQQKQVKPKSFSVRCGSAVSVANGFLNEGVLRSR